MFIWGKLNSMIEENVILDVFTFDIGRFSNAYGLKEQVNDFNDVL